MIERIPVVPLGAKLFHKACTTMNLDTIVSNLIGDLGGIAFDDWRKQGSIIGIFFEFSS